MNRAALPVLGLLWSAVPIDAFACRPFISTDPDVASVRELEIELGLTGLDRTREEGSRELVAPAGPRSPSRCGLCFLRDS